MTAPTATNVHATPSDEWCGRCSTVIRPMTPGEWADHVAGYPQSRYRRREARESERERASTVVPLRRHARGASGGEMGGERRAA